MDLNRVLGEEGLVLLVLFQQVSPAGIAIHTGPE